MKNWTTEAERRLQGYLAERVTREGFTGEDAAELAADLRRHIHEEADKAPEQTVSLLVLEQLLGRLDAGYRPPPAVGEESGVKSRVRVWSWTAGVVLPALVLVFELLTRFCASVFFDPAATWWHVALIASVPAANVWLLRRGAGAAPRVAGWAAGFAVVVAVFYGLLFLPLLHASVIALIAYGMGLLSLTPVLAAIQTWWIGRRVALAAGAPAGFVRARRWGMATAAVALAVLELPGLWTRVNLLNALADNSAHPAAVERLRAFHSENSLLKACYEGNQGAALGTDINGWVTNAAWRIPLATFGLVRFTQPDSGRVRDLFFRVTGKPFNSLPPPARRVGAGAFGRALDPLEDFEFDADTGGDAVAMRLRDLDLVESRFDGPLEGAAHLSYAEWTMVFANRGPVAREARCQVRLPAGGRVSRLTLWVDGQPQEAAFNTVGKVKAAYRAIAVVQRRDPVLVTMAGPDTVMVQCFPVPPSGTMKIRFGITAPLTDGALEMPHIIERNFGLVRDFQHAVWLQGDTPFEVSGPGAKVVRGAPDGPGFSLSHTAAQGDILGGRRSWSATELGAAPTAVWCEDPRAPEGQRFLVREAAAPQARPAARSPVVVIDGSAAMAAARDALLAAVRACNPAPAAILLADDSARRIDMAALADIRFAGGCDNGPALREAVRLAKELGGAPVLWLHGPQPVALAQSEGILQLLERGAVHAPVFSRELVAGPNRLVETLYQSGWLQRLSGAGDFQNLGDPPASLWQWRRAATADGLPGQRVSDHLARLWAAERAEDASLPHNERSALAARYQLVTPVSGAVVLETAAQYTEHGLTQGDPSASPQVPAVPEPSTALMVLLASAIALTRRWRC